jgi:hypothetical protein
VEDSVTRSRPVKNSLQLNHRQVGFIFVVIVKEVEQRSGRVVRVVIEYLQE